MKDYPLARSSAQKLIERFPNAEPSVVRRGWLVVAHSSFDLADYSQAELAYSRVLAATPDDDEARPALIETFAASIYKQGEQANDAGDYRAAADHFLRIKQLAPTSSIRAGAEYDAGAALIRLQDWNDAAQVLDDFRLVEPGSRAREGSDEADRLRASRSGRVVAGRRGIRARREGIGRSGAARGGVAARGQSVRAIEPQRSRARRVWPLRRAVPEAGRDRRRDARQDGRDPEDQRRRRALSRTAREDRAASTAPPAANAPIARATSRRARRSRWPSRRTTDFAAIELRQPFERSLRDKRQDMDAAIKTFSDLVAYEVGDVTAAATFYMAEIYSNFSHSLIESERPVGLTGRKLAGVRGRARGRSLPVRRAGHLGAREESRADARRHLQRVDREEPRAARRV